MYKANARVCEKVCLALLAVTIESDELTLLMVDVGVLPPLVDVLTVHKAHDGVCKGALTLLKFIGYSDYRRSSCVNAGVVPALVAVGKAQFGQNRRNARRILLNLGFNEDGSKNYSDTFLLILLVSFVFLTVLFIHDRCL